MALIDWTDELSVKIAEIDGEHKTLVAMINKLNDAMRQGKGKELLGEIVDGLTKYTATHFATEEKYFDKFGYPDAAKHKKQHADFVQKVSEFKSGFEQGKITLSIDVVSFLSNWLKTHILGTDKQYSEFFREKGLR